MHTRFSRSHLARVAIALATVSAFGATTWITGCGTSSSAPSADAKPVLADLTDKVILPTYRALDTGAGSLRDAAEALKTAPTADSLASAQAAWRAARKAWRQSEAFRFGPVESKSLTGAIDYWPASGEKIDQLVAGSDPMTAESFDKLGSNLKGFMALEYLLFDNAGGGDAGVLASLTGDGAAERRRLYVALAAANLKAKTAELIRSWEPAGENFAGEMANAGSGSATFPSAKSAVDQLVNSATFAGELVTNTKIAKPFGLKNKEVPVPADEETPRSDNSLADMLAVLDGVRSVYDGAYNGVDGKGIADLVHPKNAALDDRVHAALDDSFAKLNAVPAPFRTAISGQRSAVQAAYESVKAMKNTFQIDVAGLLGTTLKFNDNDGD